MSTLILAKSQIWMGEVQQMRGRPTISGFLPGVVVALCISLLVFATPASGSTTGERESGYFYDASQLAHNDAPEVKRPRG